MVQEYQMLERELEEAVKQKEETDRTLLRIEVLLGLLSCFSLLIMVSIGAFLPMEEWQRVIIILFGSVPSIVGFCYCLKIERVAGFYQCQHCGNRYVPTYKSVSLAPHICRTRYMRCPECNQKSWHKKVLSKE